ncbi:MAG: transporter permease [Patescibacteria group bacterium]|nr:ABC transporter permease [Candidatus Saccharibacteria bacterium]MDQ5963184.1 transporter permease [Patescibacteria group bacterium]
MNVGNGNFRLAWQSVRSTKLRSLLTTTGIMIGIVSVVTMICIGEGIKRQIDGQTSQFGKDVMIVRPKASVGGLLSGDGLPSGGSALLTPVDVEVLRTAPGVVGVAPLSAVSGSVKGDKEANAPLIVATTANFSSLIKQKIEGGFLQDDSGVQTAVLGPSISKKLFEDNIPLGQSFKYRGQDFMVGGVFKTFSAPPFSIEANFNDAVFISYATATNMLGSPPGIYQVLVKTKADVDPKAVSSELVKRVEEKHGGTKDVVVTGVGIRAGGADRTIKMLTYLTAGAALIAFLVGGVGIMNIMLLTVTERIHEIGLRKAIGATDRQILKQFVAEAFVLSTVGAVIGVSISLLLVFILRLYTSLQPVFVWPAFVFVPLVAVATGVLFGSFPAFKAARKDPIEALRHE